MDGARALIDASLSYVLLGEQVEAPAKRRFNAKAQEGGGMASLPALLISLR